jgi:capsular polysaccharide transport system permease protein
MGYLTIQYFDSKTRAGRLSTLFMLAEPLIVLGLLYFNREFLRGRGNASYGTSYLLFLTTGILPLYFYLRTSTLTRASQMRPNRRLPRINSMDVFMASTATNATIWIVMISAMLFVMWSWGIREAAPVSLIRCATALSLLFLLGIGVALIVSSIARFVPIFLLIFSYSSRGLIFLSGTFRIPDLYPLRLRSFLVWNPILHGVTWFRLGIYGNYPDTFFNPDYLVKCAIIALFIGLVADRATMRYAGQ